jgi:hypothetical protein
MKASDIIGRFGSIADLARDLGVPMTTVSSWGRANQIPVWRQPKLLELAAARGLSLSTTDFPGTDERIRLGRNAEEADAA